MLEPKRIPFQFDGKFDPKVMPMIPSDMEEADVSYIQNKFLDLPYSTISNSHKLDIYIPETGEGPFPVFIHIHGGGFEFGDKRDVQFVPFLKALDKGYAVVSINYRLSHEAIFPAALQDVKAAIRWLRANQEKYSLDGKRIAVLGCSAGGNLAAMLGVTGFSKEFDDPNLGNIDQSSAVQVVIDLFGPVDFLKMDEQAHQCGFVGMLHDDPFSPESRYLGKPIQSSPDRTKKANPEVYLHKDIPLPAFFIQHGNTDPLVPVQQSIHLHELLNEYLPEEKSYFEILDGAEHGDPKFFTEQNLNKVFNFISRFM